MTPHISYRSLTQIRVQVPRWRKKWRLCKAMAVSQAYKFHFKCSSIFHFAVCQLLRWFSWLNCRSRYRRGLQTLELKQLNLNIVWCWTTDLVHNAIENPVKIRFGVVKLAKKILALVRYTPRYLHVSHQGTGVTSLVMMQELACLLRGPMRWQTHLLGYWVSVVPFQKY